MVPIAITAPNRNMSINVFFVRISPVSGGRCMVSFSAPSIPKVCAGGPSITIFIHNNCAGLNGNGKLSKLVPTIVKIAPTFVDTWNLTNLLMLS